MMKKKSRTWLTLGGAIFVLMGLVTFFAPSIGLLTIASGQTTIYCPDWPQAEWSYHLFSGQDIIPLAGCYIEGGWNTHTCTTGQAVCLEKDSNNFCSHWQCPTSPTQTTCATSCSGDELQKPYPDCSCYSEPEVIEEPYTDVGYAHYAGIGLVGFGGVLIVLGRRK